MKEFERKLISTVDVHLKRNGYTQIVFYSFSWYLANLCGSLFDSVLQLVSFFLSTPHQNLVGMQQVGPATRQNEYTRGEI
jgi:hypothetical protein